MDTLSSVYDVVRRMSQRDGVVPGVRLLMKERGWRSPRSASYWLDKLVAAGLVRKRGDGALVLVDGAACPWCGKVLDGDGAGQ